VGDTFVVHAGEPLLKLRLMVAFCAEPLEKFTAAGETEVVLVEDAEGLVRW